MGSPSTEGDADDRRVRLLPPEYVVMTAEERGQAVAAVAALLRHARRAAATDGEASGADAP